MFIGFRFNDLDLETENIFLFNLTRTRRYVIPLMEQVHALCKSYEFR